MKEIRFWKTADEYGFFSNFSRHPIIEDGVTYKTSEHYFQAQKFLDSVNRQDVIDAETPKIAAEIGRDRSRPLRKDWEQVKDSIMSHAVHLKALQYPEIKRKLLATGDAIIIEDSPIDWYWGCGKDGTGRNQLGKCWMQERKNLGE